jgi:hypothetical protein
MIPLGAVVINNSGQSAEQTSQRIIAKIQELKAARLT